MDEQRLGGVVWCVGWRLELSGGLGWEGVDKGFKLGRMPSPFLPPYPTQQSFLHPVTNSPSFQPQEPTLFPNHPIKSHPPLIPFKPLSPTPISIPFPYLNATLGKTPVLCKCLRKVPALHEEPA